MAGKSHEIRAAGGFRLDGGWRLSTAEERKPQIRNEEELRIKGDKGEGKKGPLPPV